MNKRQLIAALKATNVSDDSEVLFFVHSREVSFGHAIYDISGLTDKYPYKEVVMINLTKNCEDVKIM